MGKITKIDHRPDKGRYWIFVDGEYCTSIRERTFPALELSVGKAATCAEIKEQESLFWKNSYGKQAWEKEGVRLEKVKAFLQSIDARIVVSLVGFGAGSTELIPEHPKESGAPDMEISVKGGQGSLITVEVTGTERMRGNDYWVRPDKLEHAKAHADDDAWLILHYAEPVERIVIIRPSGKSNYPVTQQVINGATELYVEFNDESPEVVTQEEFIQYVRDKIYRTVG